MLAPCFVLQTLLEENSWLNDISTKLVVKPDQLIKRRGKAGLVGLNLTFHEVKDWISKRMKKEIKIDQATGELDHFIIEPFVPHTQADEYYICIQNEKDGEELLFYSEGGVDVGDVDAKAMRLRVKIDEDLTEEMIEAQKFLKGVPDERKPRLQSFFVALFQCYRKLNFTYSKYQYLLHWQICDTSALTSDVYGTFVLANISGDQSNCSYSRWHDRTFGLSGKN